MILTFEIFRFRIYQKELNFYLSLNKQIPWSQVGLPGGHAIGPSLLICDGTFHPRNHELITCNDSILFKIKPIFTVKLVNLKETVVLIISRLILTNVWFDTLSNHGFGGPCLICLLTDFVNCLHQRWMLTLRGGS